MTEQQHHPLSGLKKAMDYALDVASTLVGVTSIGMQLLNKDGTSQGAGTVAAPAAEPTAEEKAGEFGKGYGDEHNYLELVAQVNATKAPVWSQFVDKKYTVTAGPFQKRAASEALTELRICLTSWDKDPKEIGEEVTNWAGKPKELVTSTRTVNKTVTIKLFGKETKSAVAFIENCADYIVTTRDEILSGMTVSTDTMQQATELAHNELIKQFRTAGLPTMPLPEEESWERNVDDGIKSLERLPYEMVNGLHDSLLSRRNARLTGRQNIRRTGLSFGRLVWRLAVITVIIAVLALLITLAIYQPSQQL